MVNKPNGTQNISTQNKGVNITSDIFPLPEENASEGTNNTDFPSLYDVRNQLQNVIDVMGTTTPHLIYSSFSGDADNEESVISSTSIISSVLQVKHRNRNKEPYCQSISTCNSPRDVSEISTIIHEPEDYPHPVINDLPSDKPIQPICVPAVLPPAVLCMNPSCICTHSVGYMQHMPVSSSFPNQEENAQNQKLKEKGEKKRRLSNFIEKLIKTNGKENEPAPMELYKMNIMQPKDNASPPTRFIFDLVEGAPKPEVNTVGTNTKSCNNTTSKCLCVNEQMKRVSSKKSCSTHKGICTHNSNYSGVILTHSHSDDICKSQHATYYKNLEERSKLQYKSEKNAARVDVYYFDHGNAAYYRTTDSPPLILTEILAEKAENYATKFWAELFGTIYIGFAFFTSFFLQFFRFVLHSIVRPLTIGVLQLISDYFFKPFLATLFNAVIQPPLIFFYNIATSLRDLCDPIAEGLGYFLRETAVVFKSIRLFEMKSDKHCHAEKTSKNQVC
ncbi:hypothetical protein ILUMI_01225 [Ignelater luminosus]|uniref:Uncharacterized protein n=1 Tax=Ignelater luminosus TaxID=2038154 RepID=A0A8K0DFQ1_IGNLU|nr:hypothetical protein ILUMI_01225 [Ignelater luminosus]